MRVQQFQQYTESREQLGTDDNGRDWIVFHNPMGPELIGALRRTQHGEMRGLVASTGVFLWDADLGTHGSGLGVLIETGMVPSRERVRFLAASLNQAVGFDQSWSRFLHQMGPIWIGANGSGEIQLSAWQTLIRSLQRQAPAS